MSASALGGSDPKDGEPVPEDNCFFSPISFPCGRVVPNRLVKVAMYEHMADMFGGPPNPNHFSLYSRWARHGWGMVITGNIQVSPTHLSLGRDIVVPASLSARTLEPFRNLAQVIHLEHFYSETRRAGNTTTLAIMQLSHAGRQSPNVLGGRPPFAPPLSSSPIALGSGRRNEGCISRLFHRLLFQTPLEMSLENIDDVVEAFVRGAKLAVLAGFDGVQLHAAHGYLIAQFISPKTNRRTDSYFANSLNLLHRIVTSIRRTVPVDFVLGVKVNASDYVDTSLVVDNTSGDDKTRIESQKTVQELHALEHVRTMAGWQMIDFIEISGGDYETPEFMSPSALSKSPRQAFFAHFSHNAMRALTASSEAVSKTSPPLILLTGGLRTLSHLETAITLRHTDLLGIGRVSVTCPDLPDVLRRLKNEKGKQGGDAHALFAPEPNLTVGFFGSDRIGRLVWSFVSRIQLVGAGAGMAWYVVMMRYLAKRDGEGRVQMDYNMGAVGAIFRMWITTEGSFLTGFVVTGFVLLLAGLWYCVQYTR